MTQRNSPECKAMLADRAAEQRGRTAGFRPMPQRSKRFSTRGERGETWRTKRWTEARRQDRDFWLKRKAA